LGYTAVVALIVLEFLGLAKVLNYRYIFPISGPWNRGFSPLFGVSGAIATQALQKNRS